MTKRKLAEYYYHNDYSLDHAMSELQVHFPEVTKDWMHEVWEELDGDCDDGCF